MREKHYAAGMNWRMNALSEGVWRKRVPFQVDI